MNKITHRHEIDKNKTKMRFLKKLLLEVNTMNTQYLKIFYNNTIIINQEYFIFLIQKIMQ